MVDESNDNNSFTWFSLNRSWKGTWREVSYFNLEQGLNLVRVSYPVLCVAVPRADDASSFLDHLEDDAAVDVPDDVGIVWTHDPA